MQSSMVHRNLSMSVRLSVGSVLTSYILISILSMTCVESMGSDQHHAAVPFDHSSHSLFCAFACQANIGASLTVTIVGILVVGGWLMTTDSSSRMPAGPVRPGRCVRGPPLPMRLITATS